MTHTSNEIIVLPGTGRITTSGRLIEQVATSLPKYFTLGITVQGYETNFTEQLAPGDAIIVFHPTTLQDETKIVRMVLSATSIGISSSFSTDLISTTAFRCDDTPALAL